MFDLPYIETHPLLAQIMRHCATLSEEADGLPARLLRPERDSIAASPNSSSISCRNRMLGNSRKVNRSSIAPDSKLVNDTACESALSRNGAADRKSSGFEPVRRSKTSSPTTRTTWRELAAKHRFKDRKDLERFVRRLKDVLKREGIALPTEEDNSRAAAEWVQLFVRTK